MGVLRVREFERIACGSSFDPIARVVTAEQQRRLEQFSERYRRQHGAAVFQNGPRGSLVAQNYVGVVVLSRHQVEILPKIEGSDQQVRRSFAGMLAVALDLPLHSGGASDIDVADATALEVVIALFCDALWQALRSGLVRRYEPQQDDLTVLRGRLDVMQQLRRNAARPDRLNCRFDEFTEDTLLNRLLKEALRVVMKVARRRSTVRSISELLFCFQDVSDLSSKHIDWNAATLDRLSQRYGPLLRIARLFIEGQAPDLLAGEGDGFAVLFDMNALFEEYVGRMVRRAVHDQSVKVSLQGPKRHLARNAAGSGVFELRPDIVVSNGGRPVLILDTKWKRLQRGVSREAVSSADMYQMCAYGRRYDVQNVVLLYPHHAELGAWCGCREAFAVAGRDGELSTLHVSVATVALGDLRAVPGQLSAIVSGARGLAT